MTPSGGGLDEVIRGKTINNRELAARRITELPDLRGCHLVFISDREDKLLGEIEQNVKGASVLIVGEGPEFAERGGSVQFFLEQNKLRFAINVDAVQRARLRISFASFWPSPRSFTTAVVQGGANMRSFRNLSIRFKLQGIVIAACGAALLLASVAFTVYDRASFSFASRPTICWLRRK